MRRLVRWLSYLAVSFGLLGVAFCDSLIQLMPVSTLSAGSSPRGVIAGNVFGNTMDSFIVANFGSPTFIGQNTPATVFNPQDSTVQVFSPSPTGLQLAASFLTASSPRGLALLDMYNQGKQDILVTAYDADLLQVFSWDGLRFIKTDEQPTLKLPVGVAAGSTRKGGVIFAAVADYGSNSLSLYPVKNGKLGQRIDVPVDAGPVQVAIGDLNGDGVNEIAVACLDANKIDILVLGQADPADDISSYTVSKSLSISSDTPTDLKIVDLNNDGQPDLVATNFSKNAIAIYLQQKDGTLMAQPLLETSGKHPHGLAVNDLSCDGNKEIVVANRDSDSIDIFRRIKGHYQLSQTLKTSDDSDSMLGPVELAVLDTRGTGALDLVASHMRSGSIKIFTRDLSSGTNLVKLIGDHHLDIGAPFSNETTLCYPNPSRDGKIKLSFTLDSPKAASIMIYNILGGLVWSQNLTDSQTVIGTNVVNWDGVNQHGQNLSSGLYLCCVTIGEKTIIRKAAIIH